MIRDTAQVFLGADTACMIHLYLLSTYSSLFGNYFIGYIHEKIFKRARIEYREFFMRTGCMSRRSV